MQIHILGVCGTFMAGLAIIAKQLGFDVVGTDENVYPPMSTQLQEQGIQLIQGYENFADSPQPDYVIVGNVISRGNPAMEYILREDIPYISGPQWLLENVLRDRHVIAVSGTHGKTTTTSLISWILESAGLEPGFLIGGVVPDFGVSARLGSSKYFVIEADEYDSAFFDKRSKFVHYHPRTLVINNLEFDHADIFSSLADIQKQFHHLIRIVPGNGLILYPSEDENIKTVLTQGCWASTQTYSVTSQQSDWCVSDINNTKNTFSVQQGAEVIANVEWQLLGEHNRHNALAAIAASYHVGVTPEQAAKALANFKGIKRRLEIRGVINGITVYDDFAHHPTAIQLTLEGLRKKVGDANIIAVLDFGSNTMRAGYHGQAAFSALAAANSAIVARLKDADWDLQEYASNAPIPTAVAIDIDDIITKIIATAQPHDHVVIMSNTGFGDLHNKLLTALENM